ncbi:hypothetical protein PG991_004120 [Apiospora marii]|uniref:RxLR effector protein n=1 Tax=Apiospora marii TaxID=335849 RepID=A0ABR1S5C6_9PEZI
MKRRQSSFPVLRFAAAAFVAASTTVHASTTASDGRVEATNSSSSKEVAPLPSLTNKNTTSLIHNDSSPRAPESDKGAADDESETADLEDNDISEVDQEPNELWENESGIVYGGFGWRHDKRGGEGGRRRSTSWRWIQGGTRWHHCLATSLYLRWTLPQNERWRGSFSSIWLPPWLNSH